ncbi:oligosaccharide flippase family protein [Leifsonia sp. TF02-11]|uniref:oligosaccharide flippase family protein n=1 Tax=Leifsonia sp. TF02-11 TaxID=2815212 RepID=UPI001AA0F051|nr:oligosaccharide flippase family protein [Leifsonia sp. TF02-11]MBO1739137.1 oligosaccharide flippase family protein [Leifsonia sp. TF02-11]
MTGLGRRVASSAAWSSGGVVLTKVGQFGVGIVAARLLAPHDFGVFAVTLIVYSIVVNVSELGVGSAVIRHSGPVDDLVRTAVTVAVATSALLALIMFGSSAPLAGLLGAPAATAPIAVMSIAVLLAGPSAIPSALLTREFRQDLRFRADALNFVVGSATLILFAVWGWGALAFAWSRVAGQLVSTVALILMAPKVRPGFHSEQARALVQFGMPMVGANLTGYAIGTVDVIALGRMRGAVPLGYFTLANNVASWPLGFSQSVLFNLGLPLLSRAKNDARLFARYLSTALRTSTGLFFFVAAMCSALAAPLIQTLYGERWAAAAPVLALLAVYGAARTVLALLFDAIVASGSPRLLFWVQALWLVLLIPAMIGSVALWGLEGAALADAGIAALVVVPASLLAVRMASRIAVGPLAAGLVWPTIASVASGLVAWGVASLLPQLPWLGLVLGGLAGAAAYGILMARWLRRLYTDVRGTRDGTAVEVPETAGDVVVAAAAADAPTGGRTKEESR